MITMIKTKITIKVTIGDIDECQIRGIFVTFYQSLSMNISI